MNLHAYNVPLHNHPNDGAFRGRGAPVECPRCILEHGAPAMAEALRILVAADNCNYCAKLMRSEGLFDAARRAMAKAGVPLCRKGA